MKVHIREFVRTCIVSQKNKVLWHNTVPFQIFKNPDEKFAHIYLNLVWPSPASERYSFILTMIVSRDILKPITLQEISVKTYADNFSLHWVARFGYPKFITTNRGSQFFCHELAEFLCTRLIHTTSYHQQTNGMIERLYRSWKIALRA